jgi:NAD(P)-dependent dehydrogenase (short-subunit alcohol dehydrogenase family)
MAMRLKDKVVLVTGAAQGIGACIGRLSVDEGATVIATDTSAEGARAGVPKAAEACTLDVTDAVAWKAVLDRISAQFGRLDVLVNNAGTATREPFEQCTIEHWRSLFAVNCEGAFLGIQACLPLLRAAAGDRLGGSSIINISSVAGIVGLPGQAAYNSSKAAVAHLSRSLAIEFAHGGYNVRVNSIHPGMIWTPLMEKALRMWPEIGDGGVEAVAAMAPVRRMGRVEDVAYGAIYLASDESAYVTGAQLVIDGGIAAV